MLLVYCCYCYRYTRLMSSHPPWMASSINCWIHWEKRKKRHKCTILLPCLVFTFLIPLLCRQMTVFFFFFALSALSVMLFSSSLNCCPCSAHFFFHLSFSYRQPFDVVIVFCSCGCGCPINSFASLYSNSHTKMLRTLMGRKRPRVLFCWSNRKAATTYTQTTTKMKAKCSR
ncbi:hypothetical protein BKA57DRAFT_177088 [Linnemannia elongata]|nr:hypothetical protein BKA57DRAFT_177088 [Linnemannia elongata]